jgi:hypothetical protein
MMKVYVRRRKEEEGNELLKRKCLSRRLAAPRYSLPAYWTPPLALDERAIFGPRRHTQHASKAGALYT